MRIELNDNKERVSEVLASLDENKEKYGKRYCPCVPSALYTSNDYTCMCRDFLNQEEGFCHCQLYIKYKD